MKKIIYTLAFTSFIVAGSIFSSCQTSSSTQEEENAQDRLDSAKMELKAAQTAVTDQEWESFKVSTNIKIRDNELRIADFKDKLSISEGKLNAVYIEKIDKLEKQNKNMKARVENYEKRQNNWESFKSEFNHDMDELGNALKDLTVDNKK